MPPMMARISVVLPAPFRPMRPHISRSETSSDASRTIGTGPIATLSDCTLSIGRPRHHVQFRLGAADQHLHARLAERLIRGAVRNQRPVIESQHAIRKPRDDL